MRRLALVLTLLAGAAAAQPGLRDGDEMFSRQALADLLSGQVLEFYTNGLATYRPDGSYDYRYGPDEPRIPGIYEVRENSMVCTVFQNGFDRCDYIVRAGARLVMVIENGERYPVRSVTPIE